MSSLRLHRFLVAVSLIGPLGLFVATSLHNRADVLREGKATVVRTVAVMDEHARKVFETGELVLGRADGRISALTWDEISSPAVSAFLARLVAPLDQIVSIWITDVQGVVRAGSQNWEQGSSIAEREFFRVQREGDAGAYVSAAFRGKATNVASFALSRRRTTPDGHFDGTVHIALSPEYFTSYYAAMAPDLAHTAGLVRSDGEVLAHDPQAGQVGLRLAPDSPLMRQIAQQPEGGFLFAKSVEDGTERAYAYRKVGTYPLYVAFGVDKAALLHRWHDNLIQFGVVACVSSLMLLLLSWLALRGVKAERAAVEQLRVALSDLRRETTQREQAEQRVRQAQKMEAVGQLTGGIAHDFNNLLTAVLGSLELLRKRLPPGDERALRLLNNAVQGGERGASLTKRLLAFSRAQALTPKTVDLRELVQGMSDLLRTSLGAGVRVETVFPLHLASALVDANQLELALLNLAVNARDAMLGSGKLTISVREEEVGAGQADDLAPGSYVVLGLTDTGEGMDEATLARCVEPFFTTKGVGKGTGLGLSMVYGLAEQSGGRLVLRSRKGEGTTAELWLPQAETQAKPAAVPDSGRATTAAGLGHAVRHTVLVVDDDPLVLESTASMLEDLGYAVVGALSGHQALEILLAGAKVDLIVTDHAMPGMTGIQLGSEVRRLWPRLPILLGTGYVERAEVTASGLPLLGKPFAQTELAAAVEACLSAAGQTRGEVVPFPTVEAKSQR
jgi:signal transduction histidine kinase